MAKRQSPQHQNQTGKGQSEYYCEYYCSNGKWWPGTSNTQSGYYCPETLVGQWGSCSDYSTTRIQPRELPRELLEASITGPYCEYLFVRGDCYYVGGRAREGHYCPPNLENFAYTPGHDSFYKELVQLLQHHPELVVRVTVPADVPIRLCEDLGHDPPHYPDDYGNSATGEPKTKQGRRKARPSKKAVSKRRPT